MQHRRSFRPATSLARLAVVALSLLPCRAVAQSIGASSNALAALAAEASMGAASGA